MENFIGGKNVQPRSGAHPATFSMGTGLLHGLMRLACVVNDSPQSDAKFKNE